MTTAEWMDFGLKMGGFFVSLIVFAAGMRYAVLDLKSAHERVVTHIANIETKVDGIQETLADIQIKAATHDERAAGIAGHVESIDRRVTFLERKERKS